MQGELHSLALKNDGSIVGWGDNWAGQATPPDGNDFVAIAAGEDHSLALRSDGSIVGWGYNYYGQATTPDGNEFVAIAAGGYHSLALKSDGSIVGWGANWTGQASPPVGDDFVAIAAGGAHSLSLKSDGSIFGWGENWAGQATPPAGNDFVSIAAGGGYVYPLWGDGGVYILGHSLGLKRDGSIVGWGDNEGAWGSSWLGQATPPEGNDFVDIAAGMYHSLALKSDGSIVGWGNNNYGQATPPGGNDFVAIAAGAFHSLALKSDGSIVGWGAEESWIDYGQATPPPGNCFVAIAAGDYLSLALKSDGSIVGWGRNDDGQATPPDGNDFVAIAAGGNTLSPPLPTPTGEGHSLALKSDGSIVAWGGQATPPAGNDFVAIAAGTYHSLAIRREPPIEATMKLTPQALNCHSKGKWVKAHFVLPVDFTVEDVDSNSSGQIDSLGIESDHMDVFVGEDGLVRVDMAFDRAAFCDGLTEGGSIDISVKGLLTNGHYFYGTDTIKIIDNVFEHLAFLSSQWLRADRSKPDWCQGTDIDQDSVVNLYDYAIIAEQWMREE